MKQKLKKGNESDYTMNKKRKKNVLYFQKNLEQKNIKSNKSFEKIDNIKLTNEELKAINDYVSSYSYIINEKLRNGDVLDLSDIQFIENMDKALKKYPVFEGTLKRSVTFYDQNALNEFLELHSIDNVVKYKQYLSTTKGKVYNPNAQVQIYIQNTKKGRDISINNAKENEVLYPRDTSFNILNRVENNGKHYILMEEIDE